MHLSILRPRPQNCDTFFNFVKNINNFSKNKGEGRAVPEQCQLSWQLARRPSGLSGSISQTSIRNLDVYQLLGNYPVCSKARCEGTRIWFVLNACTKRMSELVRRARPMARQQKRNRSQQLRLERTIRSRRRQKPLATSETCGSCCEVADSTIHKLSCKEVFHYAY